MMGLAEDLFVGRSGPSAVSQQKVRRLSGGERNRVHLAKMPKTGVNLLLLGEPADDLGVETLRALEVALTDYAGCAVIISHDRFFLDRITTHMLASKATRIWNGSRATLRITRTRSAASASKS